MLKKREKYAKNSVFIYIFQILEDGLESAGRRFGHIKRFPILNGYPYGKML